MNWHETSADRPPDAYSPEDFTGLRQDQLTWHVACFLKAIEHLGKNGHPHHSEELGLRLVQAEIGRRADAEVAA